MERQIMRGDMFYADLNPVRGSEQGGHRPVLIIQNNKGNKSSPTVIIAPITSKMHKGAKMPVHYTIRNSDFLERESVVLLEQIRTIDKSRLGTYLGSLPTEDMIKIDRAIKISLALNKIYFIDKENDKNL